MDLRLFVPVRLEELLLLKQDKAKEHEVRMGPFATAPATPLLPCSDEGRHGRAVSRTGVGQTPAQWTESRRLDVRPGADRQTVVTGTLAQVLPPPRLLASQCPAVLGPTSPRPLLVPRPCAAVRNGLSSDTTTHRSIYDNTSTHRHTCTRTPVHIVAHSDTYITETNKHSLRTLRYLVSG